MTISPSEIKARTRFLRGEDTLKKVTEIGSERHEPMKTTCILPTYNLVGEPCILHFNVRSTSARH